MTFHVILVLRRVMFVLRNYVVKFVTPLPVYLPTYEYVCSLTGYGCDYSHCIAHIHRRGSALYFEKRITQIIAFVVFEIQRFEVC